MDLNISAFLWNYYRQEKERGVVDAKNSPKDECCYWREGKYWDVIYGYKYWHSLESGKRIVEFAGKREFRMCFLFFLFFFSIPLLGPPPVAFRAVSDRKSNLSPSPVFYSSIELIYMFADGKVFYEISLVEKCDAMKERT